MNSTYVNSQLEPIEICEAEFEGKPVHLLVLHDDPPPEGTGTTAPMLLDEGTREWLKQRLEELDNV